MIKKIIFSVLGGLFLHIPAMAQLEKGTGYLGATISFNGSHFKFPEQSAAINRLAVNPSLQFGKFIRNNVMVGVGIGSSHDFYSVIDESQGSSVNQKMNTNEFYLSPYIRHYKSLNAKWAIFLTSSARVSIIKSKRDDGTSTNNDDGYAVGLNVKPGLAYWITPRFSLESDINLLSLDAGYKDFSDVKSFYFRSGVTSKLDGYFSVRAAWYFQKH